MNTTHYFRILCCVLFLGAIASCSEEENPVKDFSLGSIDASVYVAVGDSYTAGMQSASLFEQGQMYSYPNLIAAQIKTPAFVQPLMPYPGTGELRLLSSMSPPSIVAKNPSLNPPTNVAHGTAYHNLGIPFAIMYDALDTSPIAERGTTRGNPFYQMIMRNQTAFGVSLVDQAISLNPTFMTFWLGYSDVLEYARSGGTRGTNSGLDGNPPGKFPTEIAVFQQSVQAAFAKIKAMLPNTKVLVANIPNPTKLPYFTTVPRKVANPTNPEQPLSIYYRNNDNNVISVGPNEFVLLTAQDQLKQMIGLSPSNPLPSAFVLDDAEVSTVINAVTAYNTIIYTEALRQGFTLVDMHAYFDKLVSDGVHIAGESYSGAFITGGVFSLDGIHLSARGNGLVANHFIAAMNQAYGASIHNVQMHTLPGIPAPGTFSKR
ncbi:MAG: hypothetical protein M5R41_03580 [Bacteroidia bacterium]|nr:hypothetical protein [Bacteroidia bacterium]